MLQKMTIYQIIVWLHSQPNKTIAEFNDGINYYRWGEDLPEFGEFSPAFEIGWRFARLQNSN